MLGHLDAAIDRVVGASLEGAGYSSDDRGGWRWSDGRAFVGFSGRVVGSEVGRRGGVSLVFGWAYSTLGDPDPFPPLAEGCVRQMTIDDMVEPSGRRLSLLPDPGDQSGAGEWERRLATVWRRDVARWLESWTRPGGFGDFLSTQRLHLASAWVHAELGHRERVDLDLRTAAALQRQPLGEGFDRRRADRDAGLAAPHAARHGLATVLSQAEQLGDQVTLDAFEADYEGRPRDRVTNPDAEHQRLLRRHDVYAALCLERIRGHRPDNL